MIDKGSLIVVSGPSGSGKGTILGEFNKKYRDDKVIYSVSATTLSPRDGEIEGENYYFITKDEFEKRINEDGFLEYASYCDNYYGTPKKTVMDALNSGIDVILEIETVGAMKVKSNYPEAVMVFILPPSVEELKNRLIGRATETLEVIESRLHAARRELNLAAQYDYVIVNDSYEELPTDATSTAGQHITTFVMEIVKMLISYIKLLFSLF